MPKRPNFFDKKLPALKEDKVDNRADMLWLPETDQMKNVSTPMSDLKIAKSDNKSYTSLAQKSASVSDNDLRHNQLSVESKLSSQNGFIVNDAVSQSSSSLFDRNAF